ncbi:MAG: glycine--tRNA ligase subunit beta [Burkholderiales bacterium]
MMKNLLVELFVEELPPKSLKKLGEAFAGALFESLKTQGLAAADSTITPYASPRRLAVLIRNVRGKAENTLEEIKLMPVKVGLDSEGKPAPALLKKLASLGVSEEIAPTLIREKDETLFLDRTKEGATLAEGLQNALEEALAKLPIPKVMTYQLADGWENVKFVRPAHDLVALHGAEVVPVSILGLTSGRKTRGHRFEAKSDSLEILDADSYEAQLETEGAVIPNFEKRRAEILRQLNEAAAKIGGVKPVEDEALLDEVTALVERPNVLVGKFDRAFLEVPQECLILTMKANQKYFPLLDAHGKLTDRFLIVSNIRPSDPSAVIGGNERVVRPRLADAKFFYDQDRKKPLDSRIMGLSRIVYHNRLGSLGERVERVQAIARAIGLQLGGETLSRQADQAALLAKADLTTDMVGEFPELQGIMGRYYALHDGHSPEIAFAIEDHYRPRFSGDELPRNQVGVVVALADKLEILAGMFGIRQIPTGDKDPYALRRHALGVIRILIETPVPLHLNQLVNTAFSAFPKSILGDAHTDLELFIFERLRGYLKDAGYTSNEVESVVCMMPVRLDIVPGQLSAVRAFYALPEAESLAAANKRVMNILKQAEAKGEAFINAEEGKLEEPAEKALFHALEKISPQASTCFEKGDYSGYLKAFAALKTPVDAFFDSVMVNCEDPALRANRLALLRDLRQAMNRVADLSRLAS